MVLKVGPTKAKEQWSVGELKVLTEFTLLMRVGPLTSRMHFGNVPVNL